MTIDLKPRKAKLSEMLFGKIQNIWMFFEDKS